jgi:Leucine-rich repeat (LRR) protein
VVLVVMLSCSVSWSVGGEVSVTTNAVDLQVLHEMMYAMYYEYDWAAQVPDPCVSAPQGIVCEADAETGVLFVTQMQFGFISPMANIIPCSANASVPASIATLTRLTSLAFYRCFTNLTTSLPPSLPPSLRLLTFTQNPALSGPIPASFSTLPNLQRLILSQNSLVGPIPTSLASLASLAQLDLSHNLLSGPMPSSLANLINLDLRYNQLNGTFPPSIAQSSHNLQRLALSHNRLSGSLPDAFTGLESLTFLDLSFNELTGALPRSLGGLPNLEDLFLNANRFGSVIPEIFPEGLVRLDLSSCGFVGGIPGSLRRLESLRFLSVSDNRLSGGIPGSLASLPVIFTLNLDGNELSGPVPFEAGFVRRMGRNLQLKANAGLCYSSQLASIKVLLPGLKQCPDDGPTAPPPNMSITISGSPNSATSQCCSLLFIAASILLSFLSST